MQTTPITFDAPFLSPIPPLFSSPVLAQEETKAISKAAKTEAPLLSSYPPLLPEFHFLAFLERFETFMQGYQETVIEELSRVETDLKSCFADLSERLKENAKKMSDASFWGMLQKIATFLSAALALFTGGLLVSASHGLVGGALLASGVLSMGHFIMTETGSYETLARKIAGENEKRKKELITYLPIAVGITSAILGLSGGVGAVMAQAPLPPAMGIAQSALSLFSATTQTAQGIAKYKLNEAQACTIESQNKQEWLETLQEMTTNALEGETEEKRRIFSSALAMITAITQSNEAANA